MRSWGISKWCIQVLTCYSFVSLWDQDRRIFGNLFYRLRKGIIEKLDGESIPENTPHRSNSFDLGYFIPLSLSGFDSDSEFRVTKSDPSNQTSSGNVISLTENQNYQSGFISVMCTFCLKSELVLATNGITASLCVSSSGLVSVQTADKFGRAVLQYTIFQNHTDQRARLRERFTNETMILIQTVILSYSQMIRLLSTTTNRRITNGKFGMSCNRKGLFLRTRYKNLILKLLQIFLYVQVYDWPTSFM